MIAKFLPNSSSQEIKKDIPYVCNVAAMKLGLSIYSYQLIISRGECASVGDSAVNHCRFDTICDSRFVSYMYTGEYMTF
jgi:hypothetical protein